MPALLSFGRLITVRTRSRSTCSRRGRRRIGMAHMREAGSDRENAERETRGYDATTRGAHLRPIGPDSHDVPERSHRASPSSTRLHRLSRCGLGCVSELWLRLLETLGL